MWIESGDEVVERLAVTKAPTGWNRGGSKPSGSFGGSKPSSSLNRKPGSSFGKNPGGSKWGSRG